MIFAILSKLTPEICLIHKFHTSYNLELNLMNDERAWLGSSYDLWLSQVEEMESKILTLIRITCESVDTSGWCQWKCKFLKHLI